MSIQISAKVLAALCALLCQAGVAHASISAFSRANCGGINESITWEATGIFGNKIMAVQSFHIPSSPLAMSHSLADSGSYWRARGGDQSDAFALVNMCPKIISWTVYGYHSYFDGDSGITVNLGGSSATDCNLSEW